MTVQKRHGSKTFAQTATETLIPWLKPEVTMRLCH